MQADFPVRAETANTVEAIRKSLAILRQRMDWPTARHRLEEFDAMIEDPDLWNDAAQIGRASCRERV